MSMLRNLLVLAALALVTAASPAQDDGAGESAPADSAEAAPPAQEPATGPAQDADDDVFVPTEEIAADEEVTFPVDI